MERNIDKKREEGIKDTTESEKNKPENVSRRSFMLGAFALASGADALAKKEKKEVQNKLGKKESAPTEASLAKSLESLDAKAYRVSGPNIGVMEKGVNNMVSIASLTKIMTATVILESDKFKGRENETLKIAEQDDEALGRKGSKKVKPYQRYKVKDLLGMLLVNSNNEAALTLARAYGPSFVLEMNKKAKSLGMLKTVYVEPSGASPENKSTVSDLDALFDYVYAKHGGYFNRNTTDFDGINVSNGEKSIHFRSASRILLSAYKDDKEVKILIQKTGFINESGKCIFLKVLIKGNVYDICLMGLPETDGYRRKKVIEIIESIRKGKIK